MQKVRKKIIWIMGSLLVIFLLGKIIMAYMIQNVNDIPLYPVDFTTMEDQEKIGEYAIAPVYAKVRVTICDHSITQIILLEHDNGLGSAAEAIVNDVIREQSLEVDAISGATVSSKCILKAIENAAIKGDEEK